MKSINYYSNGKFLLTAEYLILDGALALSIPLKFGQKLTINTGIKPGIEFKTYQYNKEIYSNCFLINEESNKKFICEQTEEKHNSQTEINRKSTEYILKTINALLELKPDLIDETTKLEIKADLNFDIHWGLGSSSSLISDIAYWGDVDPYQLFKKVTNGSGYDIFAAREKSPFTFQLIDSKPEIKSINLNNFLFGNVLFVYLGKKQNSENEVNNYRKKGIIDSASIDEITLITKKFLSLKSENELLYLIRKHEEVLSSILGRQRIRMELFKDFDGEIKSLGAWGGDFVMAYSINGLEYSKNYFSSRKFDVIFQWDEIVL